MQSTALQNYFNPLPHTRENYIIERYAVTQKIFQSTPSYEGERRHAARHAHHRRTFQSTPSYEGERPPSKDDPKKNENFNPLPHTRENRTAGREWTVIKIFQSTPSYEGEPSDKGKRSCNGHFNPLPHTRENLYLQRYRPDARDFNPLPHTRENCVDCDAFIFSKLFQSTPSYEGERDCRTVRRPKFLFQSTPSYEGELYIYIVLSVPVIFQSTPSYEGEPCVSCKRN